jgi:hypothetical protein
MPAERVAMRDVRVIIRLWQVKLHLKFNPSWSYEWGPVHSRDEAIQTWRTATAA